MGGIAERALSFDGGFYSPRDWSSELRGLRRLSRVEDSRVDDQLRREHSEYVGSDHDLFDDPVEPPQSKHEEVFHIHDDLGAAERVLIASEMVEASQARWPDDENRRAKVAVEAKRYSVCGDGAMGFRCSRCSSGYYVPMYCRSRVCEACARRYTKQLEGRISGVVKQTMAIRRKGYCFSLLTLTVTSKRFGGELPDREAIVRLYRETSEFLRLHYGRFKGCRSKSGKVRENRRRLIGAGWLAVLEMGSDNNNAHCHALVYGPIRVWHSLKREWEKITGDSQGVDIRAIHGTGDGALRAIRYVLKYIGKPPVTDSYRRIADYALALKGTRRIRSGGVFYNRFTVKKTSKCDFSCPVCGGGLMPDGDLSLRSASDLKYRLPYHSAYKDSRKNIPTLEIFSLSCPKSVQDVQLVADVMQPVAYNRLAPDMLQTLAYLS